MPTLFLILALICVSWGVVSSIMIVSFLSGHGIKVNWLLLRIFLFRYVSQYHDMTRKETGKPGPWYTSFILSMNLALLFGVLGVVLLLR